MTLAERNLVRYSLSFVWLATAVASIWEMDGQSKELLVSGGIESPNLATVLVVLGAAVDAFLGLLLLIKPVQWVFASVLGCMGLMTLVATVLLPELWLHPLGPLTKNIPIAAMLWVLMKSDT
jgi:DoxX-like family